MPPTSEPSSSRPAGVPPRPPGASRPARRGRDRPGACSLAWDDAVEPAWGTASHARFWVALEQAGPWGRDAFTQSRLDPDLGRALEQRCFQAGGRALLMRVIGPEQDSGTGESGRPRRVFVASGMPGRPWLLAGYVTDPALVLDLDLDAVAAGDVEAVLASTPWLRRQSDPVALVCTNSKRDVCCAVRGRPVATAAATARPGQVWECSHTGGHRFAPTGVLLPHGVTFARCETEVLVEALDTARDDLLPAPLTDSRHLRGLSYLWPAEQAADAYVRDTQNVRALTQLGVQQVAGGSTVPEQSTRAADGTAPEWVFDVTHVDGRSWRVVVRDESSGELRVSSCGAQPVPVHAFTVRLG